MDIQPLGLHHVTAIATDPSRNVEFYARVLGLRLVKQTVNFDAPDTYHLYYGDKAGTPGTVITFFPWPATPRGRRGAGQATTTALSIPEGSLGYWSERLRDMGVEVAGRHTRASDEVLAFEDPDGLLVQLLAHPGTAPQTPWEASTVPGVHQIRGFHSVTLTERRPDATVAMLTGMLGFSLVEEDGDRLRFAVGEGGPGRQVDVVVDRQAPEGLVAAGTVHHIAWRAPDDDTQVRWRSELVEEGVKVTPVIDRQYFHSIYFREPGGVLLEIATDAPGFDVDEPLLELGRRLRLPPWLEPSREDIERALPALKLVEDRKAQAADAPGGQEETS
ncbi:MAG TPA: ring-cleaving dioxygenase [Egibacteraceae bacterium]|jgi:glyoxalase family protein|nr:ring-cleaving dioxygenase [Egibacteraceae bacterium]